jgi:DNA-binding NarL/FixJ family response regulator
VGSGAAVLRVVIADDSYLVREAIAHVLASEPGLELVATCADGEALLAAIDVERPDVVLTDARMPPSGDREGITIANCLRETHPQLGVVLMSQYASASYAHDLLAGGSDRRAYLLKDGIRDRHQLVTALETVAAGGSIIDSKIVRTLIAARADSGDSPLDALTPRELEVLAAIAGGRSNQAIAGQLGLTKRAVEKRINAIFEKLGVSDDGDVSRRVAAALIYIAERDGPDPEG